MTRQIGWRRARHPGLRAAFTSVIYALPFLLLLASFHLGDVYDRAFFSAGVSLPYNLARATFIVYLSGLICVPGFVLLRLVAGATTWTSLPPLVRLIAGFFCGAALWHTLLLVLGFADLYLYPAAVVLGVSGALLTPGCVGPTLTELCDRFGLMFKASSRPDAAVKAFLIALVLSTAGVLLLVKGLYPAGGHDYFTHYFGYDEAVLRNHGLWPNDVWYHFYYSKGMGLFYLSMMLTDPLAPSLVSYSFTLAAAAALYLLVDRMAPAASNWPWVAAIGYLAFDIYTPGFGVYLTNGGWGDFQKPHEIGAAFVVGFVWLCVGLRDAPRPQRRIWLVAAASCIFITAFIETITVLVLGLFTVILTAVALARRRRNETMAFLALDFAGGVGLVALLLLNYAVTGLVSDEVAVETWPWADVQKLAEAGMLPYLVTQMQAVVAMRSQAIPPPTAQFVDFFRDQLRFDLVRPARHVFFPLLGAAMLWRFWRPRPGQDTGPLWLLLAFLGSVAVAAASAGRAQPISFYRYTAFCLPIVIGLLGCGWLYIAETIGASWPALAIRRYLPIVWLAMALVPFARQHDAELGQIVPHAAAFADGSMSIEDAYSDQRGWPGRAPWGAIFPGMVDAWRIAGPDTRIWSMHLLTYCMLPHCRIETFFSFILSRHLPELLRGPAEDARAILRREGVNYFFYTTAMDIKDILPLVTPFTPDNIAHYVGVKWTDSTSYLLTWLGPGIAPLTPEWVEQYRRAVAAAPGPPNGFPVSTILDMDKQLHAGAHWGRELKVPGVDGD